VGEWSEVSEMFVRCAAPEPVIVGAAGGVAERVDVCPGVGATGEQLAVDPEVHGVGAQPVPVLLHSHTSRRAVGEDLERGVAVPLGHARPAAAVEVVGAPGANQLRGRDHAVGAQVLQRDRGAAHETSSVGEFASASGAASSSAARNLSTCPSEVAVQVAKRQSGETSTPRSSNAR